MRSAGKEAGEYSLLDRNGAVTDRAERIEVSRALFKGNIPFEYVTPANLRCGSAAPMLPAACARNGRPAGGRDPPRRVACGAAAAPGA